jgi:hypothetical protein
MLHATTLSVLFWIGCVFSSGAAVAGVFAIVWPTRFASCAGFWGKWVETKPTVPIADHRVDIDQFVLNHTRAFGGIVLTASLFWLFLLYQIV